MKILSCSISGGDVCAAILAEKEDCARYGGGHAAVEGCIELFRREKELSALALVRVTRLEETAEGGLSFDFDAAALWDMALAVSDELNAGNMRARSTGEITELLAAALFPGGGGDHAFSVLEKALDSRAEQKRSESMERLAEESFAAYLRMAGKTEAELRGEFRPQATDLVRIDLLIDAVARRENITLSDEEFDAALEKIASLYELPPAEVLGMIGASTLRFGLIRDKARAMIVGSADTF